MKAVKNVLKAIRLAVITSAISIPASGATLTRSLPAGAVIKPEDVAGTETDASVFVGKELRRYLPAGSILQSADLRPPTLVTRNRPVRLEYAKGPLLITAEGRALSSGAEGDAVQVINLTSRNVLTGIVIGADRVEVR